MKVKSMPVELTYEELEEQVHNLEEKLHGVYERIATLKRLVPICASCKKIREDADFRLLIQQYVQEHVSTELISNSLCPDCRDGLYEGLSRL